MKIILAVDGSLYTKRMLSYLAAHEELVAKGHAFVAAHVTPEVPPHAARHLPHDTLAAYYADEAEKVLKPVREFAHMQGWAWREQVAVGPVGETLARIVEAEKPDLLVMGSHGHGSFTSALLGSVAGRLLSHTQVPVLLVR